MVFDVKPKEDKFLENIYKRSMKELNGFYGINWIKNIPSVFIVKDRKTIDKLWNKKTERWIVGWANSGNVYLLDRKNFKRESAHKKYDEDKYEALLKHELSHLFFNILSNQANKRTFPVWLSEGVAVYTSGQLKFKAPIIKFSKFLGFYKNNGTPVYTEAGFFIEILVKKYGKEKLLKLIKSLKGITTKKEFDAVFSKIYRFKLNYKEINKL